jgi:hypothetical protein
MSGCFPKGNCSNITCSGTQVAVAGKDLLNEADGCCVERANCSSMSPPLGYTLKSNASDLLCVGAVCDSDNEEDVSRCCDENVCSELADEGYIAENAAATTVSGLGTITCSVTHVAMDSSGLETEPMASCNEADGSFALTGCLAKGACVNSACPPETHVPRAAYETLNYTNVSECCVERAECSSMTCGASTRQIDAAADVRCAGAE